MNHQVVRTKTGFWAMLNVLDGEVMHPGVGPLDEARILYVEQSQLGQRLEKSDRPLVVFDVGLGAGSIALAARAVSESAPAHCTTLEIVSFERDLEALALALEHPEAFGLNGEPGEAARGLLKDGFHQSARTYWRVSHGDVFEKLASETSQPDIVYWDMYSPRKHAGCWTVAAFSQVRKLASPHCTLFTYTASTAPRIAMLCAGWAVGLGDSIGEKWQTTAAAIRVEDLKQPLTVDWLARLHRSDVPLPEDVSATFLEDIKSLPQFRK